MGIPAKAKGDFDTVWKVADEPYDRDAAQQKSGCSYWIWYQQLGPVESATLDIAQAICTIKWKNGVVFRTFVDATQPLPGMNGRALHRYPC